ncbi:hypothetical protein [uncultured Sphingomonas sp.]|uniref:hypothetical protein n=1 Tax=uncultured Sphingomonas sp. TaxID=158754 RepID=UPI0035C9CB7E
MSDDTKQDMDKAMDAMSVAPPPQASNNAERDPRQDAGQDRSIEARLQKDPESVEARLDAGLDETMDGSDPVSIIQPGKSASEPAPSSGFDPDAEKRLRDGG